MKPRRCGRIKHAPSNAPCDCFNAVHQCSRNELHFGEHRCTCEHQWDDRMASYDRKGDGA